MHAVFSVKGVLSVLNFFTCEGVNHYPDSCDGSAFEALITDYFKEGKSNGQNEGKNNHRNKGKNSLN